MPVRASLRRLKGRAALVVTIVLLTACGGGGGGSGVSTTNPATSPPTPPPAPEPPPVDSSAADLADELNGQPFAEGVEIASEALALRDPEQVVASGLSDVLGLDGVTLTNVSFEYRQVTYDMWQVVREYLDGIDRSALSTDEQLSMDVFSWMTDAALAERDVLRFEFQDSYFVTSETRQDQTFFSQLHPLETEQDARDYLTRLRLVDDKLAQVEANLRESESQGVIEPSYTLNFSARIQRDLGGSPASTHPYYERYATDVETIEGLAPETIEALREEARAVLENEIKPAYLSLATLLDDQLARASGDIGVGQFEGGRDYYRRQLRYHTTTGLSAEEVHELGNREVARVQADLAEHFVALGYPEGEPLADSLARVASDGGTVPADEILATYEAMIDDAEQRLTPLFNRLPVTEVIVVGGERCCFYIGASLDGSRPGAFYASDNRDLPYFGMRTLAYHEAMPGHHLQIALEQELGLPLFRLQAQFTGYIEGWALYTERLASEENWYEGDPYGDIGRLRDELLRATRLVVDTGIHHYGWSAEQSISYLQENLGATRGQAEGAVGRYSLWPGQATAYMVGMLEILRLRELVRESDGDSFSIADFHSLILEDGSMPLEQLDDRVQGTLSP